MTFEIEHDVPIPRKGKISKYPFDDLEVGDSFFVCDEDVKSGNAYHAMGGIIRNQNIKYSEDDPVNVIEIKNGKRKGEIVPVKVYAKKFSQKRAVKDGQNGTRIHRVK